MAAQELPLVLSIVVTVSILCACNASFTPADNYLINCGSSVNTNVGGRVFLADTSFSSTLQTPQTILASTTASSVSSFDSSHLYQTARIFTGASSYSFQIQKQGRHFIRLYFFPFVYQSYDLTAASFNVSTQEVALLTNFQAKSNSSAMKEYSVNITRNTLILSFVPSTNLSFVNAIEVVSVPDNLITDSVQVVNPNEQYLGLAVQPLETVYRINMGTPKVLPEDDALWRTWIPDQSFIVDKSITKHVNFTGELNYMDGLATEEIGPYIVYGTATELVVPNTSTALINMTWQFNVDASSSYLIRFHFCDIVSKAVGQVIFNVYVNSWAVARDFDFSSLTINSLAAPIYMDFVLLPKDATNKINIGIGLSRSDSVVKGGILNGLEIMKMNFSSGSVVTIEPASSKKKNFGVILGLAVGASAVLITVIVVVFILTRRRKPEKQPSKSWIPFSINGLTNHSTEIRTSNGATVSQRQNGNLDGYRFSFTALQEATNNFDENLVIGVGGFGKVYKGVLKDDTQVAVKRGNPGSQQGLNEFRTEIELLSRLRHRHLVSLIGYCDERREMILVYEYMEKGTLKSHLYGSDFAALSWRQRLEICIGAARGLHYLHTGSAKAIIHRDVKSANILLDENNMAKVADFGLSKTGPELDQTHVSTAVKGSFGYLDPEYFRRQQLTEKSDVYSFGVVLLEVLCSRPVIDPTLPRDMVNLAEWAMNIQKRGELHLIVDQRISETIRPESLRKFGETAEKCLADCGVERPTIGDVLWNLEYVLQLQEGVPQNSEVNSINRIAELSSQVQNVRALESVVTVEGAGTSNANDLTEISMSQVFSELIKSEGR